LHSHADIARVTMPSEFVTLIDNTLQVLAKDNTVVLAGARSPDKSEFLKSLQRQYSARLQILSLDVACTSSIQVLNDSLSEATARSFSMLCKALCTIPRQQPSTLQISIFSRALTTWSTTLVSPVQDKIVLSEIPLLAPGCFLRMHWANVSTCTCMCNRCSHKCSHIVSGMRVEFAMSQLLLRERLIMGCLLDTAMCSKPTFIASSIKHQLCAWLAGLACRFASTSLHTVTVFQTAQSSCNQLLYVHHIILCQRHDAGQWKA